MNKTNRMFPDKLKETYEEIWHLRTYGGTVKNRLNSVSEKLPKLTIGDEHLNLIKVMALELRDIGY